MITQLKETMAYVLGIDIGTSFTAAAVQQVGDLTPSRPQTLTLGSRTAAVPSVLFFSEDGRMLVGEAAERRGLDRPDLVVREFKRRIGDAVPIIAGDLAVAPQTLYARMARWVVDRATEREGAAPESVILTRPASWGGHKTAIVREALAEEGLADSALLSEPEAAALQYASEERLQPGSTIAVYDFGGGTFDVAVLRKETAQSFAVLGQPEGIEGLGGADFDQAVFEHVVASVGVPFHDLDLGAVDVHAALARVRRECVEAKEALSYDSEASIAVLLPGTQTRVRLVRAEFEGMIEGPVRETIGALRRSLQTAGCDVDDLDAILLVGGSSRVPLIAQLLSGELDRPIAIDADPKASICLGAAFFGAATFAEQKPVPVPLALGESAPAPERTRTRAPAWLALRPRRTGARVTLVAATVASLMVLTGTASHFAGITLLSADTSAHPTQAPVQPADGVAHPVSDTTPASTKPAAPGIPAPGSRGPGRAPDAPVPSPSPDLYAVPGANTEDQAVAPPLTAQPVSNTRPRGDSAAQPPRNTSVPMTPTGAPTPTSTPTSTPAPTPAPPAATDPPVTPAPTTPPTTDPPTTDPPPTTPPPTDPPAAADPPVIPPATDPPATQAPTGAPLTPPEPPAETAPPGAPAGPPGDTAVGG